MKKKTIFGDCKLRHARCLKAFMRKLLFILIGFLALSADIVKFPFIYQREDTNAKIKAVFLYNFTRYFEWPNKSGSFIITIVGEDNQNQNLIAELNKVAASKMVGNQKIEIKGVREIKEVDHAHILFLHTDKSNHLADAIAKYKGKGTLIITEKAGLAKVGAAINFIVEENKQKFELNEASASKAGLKISSALRNLAAANY